MKQLIIDFLWYLLNKLDKPNIIKANINGIEAKVVFYKRYYRRGEWTNLTATINYWVLINKNKPIMLKETAIYSRGLKKKEIIELSK